MPKNSRVSVHLTRRMVAREAYRSLDFSRTPWLVRPFVRAWARWRVWRFARPITVNAVVRYRGSQAIVTTRAEGP